MVIVLSTPKTRQRVKDNSERSQVAFSVGLLHAQEALTVATHTQHGTFSTCEQDGQGRCCLIQQNEKQSPL